MKAKRKGPSGVAALLKQFGQEHARVYKGTPYLCAFRRDSRIMRDMLEVYSATFMRELIHCFWMAKQKARTEEEYYIGKAKPSVPGFLGALPNLISEFEFDTPPDERAAVGPAQGELPDEDSKQWLRTVQPTRICAPCANGVCDEHTADAP